VEVPAAVRSVADFRPVTRRSVLAPPYEEYNPDRGYTPRSSCPLENVAVVVEPDEGGTSGQHEFSTNPRKKPLKPATHVFIIFSVIAVTLAIDRLRTSHTLAKRG
jgi:hypothetical protein